MPQGGRGATPSPSLASMISGIRALLRDFSGGREHIGGAPTPLRYTCTPHSAPPSFYRRRRVFLLGFYPC